MNPTSNSESSSINTHADSQANNILIISSQSNFQDMLSLSQAVRDTSAPNTQTQNQSPQQASVTTSAQANYENLILPVHPTVFFYRPPNDFYHYRVNCEEIPYDTIEGLLKKLFNDKGNITQFKEDECIFCYQQKCNNQFYQVSCKIISPLLINNCLSKKFLGIELQQNMEQEHLAFTLDQKEYLELHLKRYLSQYLLN